MIRFTYIGSKKLGLELSTLTKTSESLLNFEDSILNEMEPQC